MPARASRIGQERPQAVSPTSPALERIEALISDLRPHPRNYRQHPSDQLEHIKASIREHGVYRNVVTARDNTILAGHGVVKALAEMKVEKVEIVRLDIDPDSPAALKLLAGDNEIGHLAEVNDETFIGLLSELKDAGGLLGTGYDEAMLANLIYVTRGEEQQNDDAAAWADAGMPEFASGFVPAKLIISFRSEDDRAEFCRQFGIGVSKRESKWWSAWWPPREAEDTSSVRFENAKAVQ